MSFFTGFMQGAATEAVEIQKENKTRRQELVDKAMDRFYEFTLPEQRKYAERQRKLTSTMRALEAAGYSKGEARALISASGEDATAAQILQYAKPPKGRTTATQAAPEMDQTTAALGAGTTEPTATAGTETAAMAPEMPTAGAAPEVSTPTDTQTASTTPAGGFDLGRVLFDQNSPERTTGAILAALSAETGLKPEQIDAYLRGEFGSDVMQGEMAPIELEPVSAGERWKNEQQVGAAELEFEREKQLAETAFQRQKEIIGIENTNRLNELERRIELEHQSAMELAANDPDNAPDYAKYSSAVTNDMNEVINDSFGAVVSPNGEVTFPGQSGVAAGKAKALALDLYNSSLSFSNEAGAQIIGPGTIASIAKEVVDASAVRDGATIRGYDVRTMTVEQRRAVMQRIESTYIAPLMATDPNTARGQASRQYATILREMVAKTLLGE